MADSTCTICMIAIDIGSVVHLVQNDAELQLAHANTAASDMQYRKNGKYCRATMPRAMLPTGGQKSSSGFCVLV